MKIGVQRAYLLSGVRASCTDDDAGRALGSRSGRNLPAKTRVGHYMPFQTGSLPQVRLQAVTGADGHGALDDNVLGGGLCLTSPSATSNNAVRSARPSFADGVPTVMSTRSAPPIPCASEVVK